MVKLQTTLTTLIPTFPPRGGRRLRVFDLIAKRILDEGDVV
jgi:hypothetical protein